MSLDAPQQNKMMTAPVAKKGFHFASDGLHYAEFIEAETTQEAEAIYHQIKRRIIGAAIVAPSNTIGQPDTTIEKSTPAPEKEEASDAVQ